jgi:multisubunit Na+/H+ antiporter MnhC subunit
MKTAITLSICFLIGLAIMVAITHKELFPVIQNMNSLGIAAMCFLCTLGAIAIGFLILLALDWFDERKKKKNLNTPYSKLTQKT